MSVLQEIQSIVKSKSSDYLKLAKLTNDLDTEGWNALSTPAQVWVNEVLTEDENARDQDREPVYPEPDGAPEKDAGEDGGEADASTENEQTDGDADGGEEADGETEQEEVVETHTETTSRRRSAASKPNGDGRKKRTMSEETKKKIAAATRARHAAKRGDTGKKTAAAAPAKRAAAAPASNARRRVAATSKTSAKAGGDVSYELQENGDHYDIVKVQRVDTVVASVFDADVAKKLLADLQG